MGSLRNVFYFITIKYEKYYLVVNEYGVYCTVKTLLQLRTQVKQSCVDTVAVHLHLLP